MLDVQRQYLLADPFGPFMGALDIEPRHQQQKFFPAITEGRAVLAHRIRKELADRAQDGIARVI